MANKKPTWKFYLYIKAGSSWTYNSEYETLGEARIVQAAMHRKGYETAIAPDGYAESDEETA